MNLFNKRNLSYYSLFCILLLFLFFIFISNLSFSLTPRMLPEKPKETVIQPWYENNLIEVKFKDGLKIKVENKKLNDFSSGILSPVRQILADSPSAEWSKLIDLPESEIMRQKMVGEANTGKELTDLNLYFLLQVPEKTNIKKYIDNLNKLDIVELAKPVLKPMPPPLPPDYQSFQGYLNAATGGIDAVYAWTQPGGDGTNVSICDLEYDWNYNHNDYVAQASLTTDYVDPGYGNDHGTAVLGEMGGLNNSWGVKGIVYNCTLKTVGTYYGTPVWNIAGAITIAVSNLTAGDVILIEQQYPGPNYTNPLLQDGLVPVEYDDTIYYAIVNAVSNNINVVEAGGNGKEDLDNIVYANKFTRSFRDSGAIIVGAGAVPGGSDVDRSRLVFSNYGSRVDVQGWGEGVCTTGYGYLYSAEGADYYYVQTFAGTSSASPIIAGAAASLEGIYKSLYSGQILTPVQVRNLLTTYSSPQQAGTYPISQNIGPRPNLQTCISNLPPDVSDWTIY